MFNKSKLNLFAFDKGDSHFLWDSIANVSKLKGAVVVFDLIECKIFIQFIKSKFNLHPSFELQLQNLFKVYTDNATFYIGQLLLDQFYYNAIDNEITNERQYSFHLVGLAKATLPIRNMTIHPKPTSKNNFQKNLFNETYEVKFTENESSNDIGNFNAIFNEDAQRAMIKDEIYVDINDACITINFE